MLIDLTLRARDQRIILITIIALNVFLLTGSGIISSSFSELPLYLQVFFRETDLASENVFAAWYSSMLLFLSAVMSVGCFFIDQQRFRNQKEWALNYGWLIYALVFGLLSFDELGSIHEHIGDFIAFAKVGNMVSDSKDSGWISFYILVALVGLFMFVFSIVRLKKARFALLLLVAGLLMYLSNPFQEFFEIESMRAAVDREVWKRPVYFLLLEEGTEVFGSLFFLISLTLYARHAAREPNTSSNDVVFRQEINTNVLMRIAVYFLLALALSALLIDISFGDVVGELQRGVPKNWITAVTAFFVSMQCLVFFNKHKAKSGYLLFSVFSFCLSIYYGSNRFAHHFDSEYSHTRVLLRSLLGLFAFVSYLLLIRSLKNKGAKLASIVSFAILVCGIFARRPYSAEITFIALCCMVILLCRTSEAENKKQK